MTTDATAASGPQAAWDEMAAGNARFVAGAPRHPHQDADRRAAIAAQQTPDTLLFGCSDSRLAAEIIFDRGLGDLFVVRNAGQVMSPSVLGSVEYAVAVLEVPLIVVLGHDACGAVAAAIGAADPEATPLPPHIADLIAPIAPAVARATHDGVADPAEVGREHLRDTVGELLRSSEIVSEAVAAGRLAIVGANYRLSEGRVIPDTVIGELAVAA
jgi:carbonic anhydrase